MRVAYIIVAWMVGAGALLEASRPISKEALTVALRRGGMSSAEVAGVVRSTGVSFALTPADEQALKALGAGADLLDAVRSSRSTGSIIRSAGKPMAPVELLLKLFHATPVAAAAAVRSRGAGFDLTPALETQILEAGGDKALLGLVALRRLEVEPVAAAPSAQAESEIPLPIATAAPRTAQPAGEGQRPVRMDPAAQARKLVRKAEVEYPQMAYRARMSGSVVVEALIGKDGRVRRTRVLRGHEIFREAATIAVEQYVYKPTLLDEAAVDVITEVAVEFDLNRAELGMKN